MSKFDFKVLIIQFVVTLNEGYFMSIASRLDDFDNQIITVHLRDVSYEINTKKWNPTFSIYRKNVRFSVDIKEPKEAFKEIAGYLNYINSGKTI